MSSSNSHLSGHPSLQNRWGQLSNITETNTANGGLQQHGTRAENVPHLHALQDPQHRISMLPTSVVAAYGGNAQSNRSRQSSASSDDKRRSETNSQHITQYTHFTYDDSGAPSRLDTSFGHAPQQAAHRNDQQLQERPQRPQAPATLPQTRSAETALRRQSAPTPIGSMLPIDSGPTPSPTHANPQAPSVHPIIVKTAAKALSPIRHMYEQAWFQTVTNVQIEMSRMHSELTLILDAERKNHAYTAQMHARARDERDSALAEVKVVRKENAELTTRVQQANGEAAGLRDELERTRMQYERIRAENQLLLRAQRDNDGLREDFNQLREEEGQRAAKEYMDSRVGVMRAEFEKQMELQMTVVLKEVQEQKTLRVNAERKLEELKTPSGVYKTEPDNRNSEPATLVGSPESQGDPNVKQEHEEHVNFQRYITPNGAEQPHDSHTPTIPSSPVSRETLSLQRRSSTRQSPNSSRHPSSLPLSPPYTSPAIPSLELPYGHSEDDNTSGNHQLSYLPVDSLNSSHSTMVDQTSPPSHAPHHDSHNIDPSPSISNTHSHLPTPLPITSTTDNSKHPGQQNSPPRSEVHRPPLPPPPRRSNTSEIRRPPPSSLPPLPLPPRRSNTSPGGARKRDRGEFERDGDPSHATGRERSQVKYPFVRSRTDSTAGERAAEGGSLLRGDMSRSAQSFSWRTGRGPPEDQGTKVGGIGPGSEDLRMADPNPEEGGLERKTETASMHRPSASAGPRIRTNKIGINHMDLLYETRHDKMVCRMCRTPGKDQQSSTAPASFPTKATWAELVGHCQTAHPKACEDLEKLSPSQIAELRQRMTSSKSSAFALN